MKGVIIVLATLVSLTLAVNIDWETWKQQNGRVYPTSKEEKYRHAIWTANVERSRAEATAFGPGAEWGPTKFSDMTQEEFASKYLTTIRLPSIEEDIELGVKIIDSSHLVGAPPASLDYRYTSPSRVTSVKDQGSCGSCWTFAATATIEGAYAYSYYKTPINLSPQQLVDCCVNYYYCCYGCSGGTLEHPLWWFQENNATTLTNYPYTGSEGTCKTISASNQVRGFMDGVWRFDTLSNVASDSVIMNLLYLYGPMPVAVDASNWSYYYGGIFSGSCSIVPNHAVTLVGYGTDSYGNNYWLIKNSWGTYWGESGYIKLPRRDTNICGMRLSVVGVYPMGL